MVNKVRDGECGGASDWVLLRSCGPLACAPSLLNVWGRTADISQKISRPK